jgi:hypothetical protein
MRLIKRAFQDQKITLPDLRSQVVFPQGMEVRMVQDLPTPHRYDGRGTEPQAATPKTEQVAVEAEAGLHAETEQIQEQATHARAPAGGENLLNQSG